MTTNTSSDDPASQDAPVPAPPSAADASNSTGRGRLKWLLHRSKPGSSEVKGEGGSTDGEDEIIKSRPEKWSLGVLNDRETDEVPGSVLLMSNTIRNEPLGLRNAPARTSASSLPSPYPPSSRPHSARPPLNRKQSAQSEQEKKLTKDGKMILEPQPDDSLNDPLNWPTWRRDIALISLGFYCMVGGGMTPILAAGFSNVAESYDVSIPQVALTTGLYMMGLGLGSVIASPTAILFGKRPVYLVGIILFVVSSVWCALSPNYASLVVARIFQGFAVSPVECLPSATIAEIYYLHERAYRLGIYTLLLLSGKNLVPLVSAAIIEGLGWRWVFWIVAIVVGFCLGLVFLFVPETFWDRTPRPHVKHKKHAGSFTNFFHHAHQERTSTANVDGSMDLRKLAIGNAAATGEIGRSTIAQRRQAKNAHHVGFAEGTVATEMDEKNDVTREGETPPAGVQGDNVDISTHTSTGVQKQNGPATVDEKSADKPQSEPKKPSPKAQHEFADLVVPRGEGPKTPALHNFNSPYYSSQEKEGDDYMTPYRPQAANIEAATPGSTHTEGLSEKSPLGLQRYTTILRNQPPKTYAQTLKPWNGRLSQDKWLRAAFRPLILFVYPAILWSALVYSLSIGWLIVLSESITTIYKNKDTYNFNSLQAGIVYISPFVGGILGTAVAGKVSDLVVRYMSRRNGGIYEPEFRLVMALPILVSTSIGLMGFGWSVEERDNYMVPTVFFGVISFGCSLGSTTSITFAVDSYRQYAGEALVTLNFSKNIFHGLVFSLFFNHWLDSEGPKDTFVAIGGIQIACLLTTIPMYIYGKRARMWTVRKNLMEKF